MTTPTVFDYMSQNEKSSKVVLLAEVAQYGLAVPAGASLMAHAAAEAGFPPAQWIKIRQVVPAGAIYVVRILGARDRAAKAEKVSRWQNVSTPKAPVSGPVMGMAEIVAREVAKALAAAGLAAPTAAQEKAKVRAKQKA